ncbi:related to AAA family ATPase [Cephalotrichum gorgonifer]|uniref:Related to AAA family ATPase n=1 Tax=Cephalotrichum gorgonifer TaxID=2041049 RepID=A0AAE8SYK9_9PEZI|nr:related to AAA family ATPase [Cephalotrichum gorgonifer]
MSLECRIRPNAPSKPPKPEDKPDLRKPPILLVNRAGFELLERSYGVRGSTVYVCVERLEDGEKTGDAPAGEGTRKPIRRLATVMPATQDMKGDVVKMARAYMEGVGFHTGDLVRITAEKGPPKEAERIIVEDVTGEAALEGDERVFWEMGVAEYLRKKTTYIYPGANFELKLITSARLFRVVSVNAQVDNLARVQPTMKVSLAYAAGSLAPLEPSTLLNRSLVVDRIPGLGPQITALNEFLSDLQSPSTSLPFDPRWDTAAIAIHGGRGTGKTFVLNKIASSAASTLAVLQTDKATGPNGMREVFAQAMVQAPSILLIDDIDELIEGQRAQQSVGFIATMLDEVAADAAKKGSAGVIAIATCKDYFALPHELRRLSRFARGIALPIPDVPAKLEILKSFDIPLAPDVKDEVILEVAKRTYAFNPEDLKRLVANARQAAIRRHRKEEKKREQERGQVAVDGPDGDGKKEGSGEVEFCVRREELEGALSRTSPSSLNDINLRPPTVHWKDIGGQSKVKDELQRMIREVIGQSPLCLEPPKGILLYGPPGCAKTFTAQALATESGFNFFSVKGPELLSQYVGETERAIRRLFQRAASSAPSIIFFDELDTMGITPRRSGGGGGGSSGGSGGVGIGVLGALLTELDGFETLEDVVVLAATNSPESIEPALLRSGRLDRYLFVGPPGLQEREEIFAIYTGKVPTADNVDLAELARLTEGYTGADIRGVVNEAGHVVFTERGGDVEGAVIGMDHIRKAIEARGPSVTPKMLERYTKWKPSLNFRT